LVPNTSTSLQTTLATEAHLAEAQFLLKEQISSDILKRNSKTNKQLQGQLQKEYRVDTGNCIKINKNVRANQ
jgi:hypothetical protein